MKEPRHLTLGILLLIAFSGCGRPEKTEPNDLVVQPAKDREKVKTPPPKVQFANITDKAGIRFTHTSGAFGKKLLPETMGAGVAFLDYDKDGKPDLLFINSRFWPGHEPKDKPAPTLALYRNKGDGTFEDVTQAAGMAITMYGMGVTVGDFDNDGWPDLFITGVGGNKLLRNEQGKRFADVTAKAGDLGETDSWPGSPKDFLAHSTPLVWGTSTAFLDYDNDGKLDLFVCNYVKWAPKLDLEQKFTLTGAGERTFGPPKAFQGVHCTLYRNKGDGTFANVTVPAGITVSGELGVPVGKALGVIVSDVDEDGYPDIIVANDTVRNFFFHNQRDGTFKERGLDSGIAYAEGTARGAMGIDWGEYRPGKKAVAIGNFANEPNTLMRLEEAKKLLFADVALIEGLAGPSRIVLKFGLFFFDFDLDGLLDLLTCNGHLEPNISQIQSGQSYKQPVQLFWNCGKQPCFELIGAKESGNDLFEPIVGRGSAFADIDGDGSLDIVLTENNGPAHLFKNMAGTGNHWVRLQLEGDGKRCNTSAIGARILLTADGKTQSREITSCRGYLSQSELTATFGLGKATKIDKVEIIWPGKDSPRQELTDVAIDRLHVIQQAR